MTGIGGKVMGGETPISGANVILWQTTSNGYGATAVQLATTTSTAGGAFHFNAGSYTCAAGQYVYVTSTGGDVSDGNNIINNQEVQIAALGSCSHFDNATDEAKINIIVNEVSTVAAGYALRNFISVTSSTTGNQLVNIGAPAANNATTGTCTGTGPGKASPGMVCTAAGLGHAFANAIMLTDSVHYDGSFPTGLALTTVSSNNSTLANASGSIPQTLIHSLANSLQQCTNTASGSGIVGAVTVTAPGTGYTVPTVTITDASGPGTGATATLSANTASGAVTAFTITNGGSGYVSPVFTVNGLGSGAVVTATNTGGVLSAGVVSAGGSGYTTTSVSISGVGTGATASATINGSGGVSAVQVISGGSGYTSAPSVSFSDPNGTGAMATATTSSAICNSLFTATGAYDSNATDLLSAIMAIALAGNRINPTTIFNLTSATPAFQPTLSTAPQNYGIAITYTGITVSGTTTSITYPQSVALDANDDVYVLSTNMSSGYANQTATAPVINTSTINSVQAMTSSGTGLWASVPSGSSGYNPFCYAGEIAMDPFSNLWVASGPTAAQETGTGCYANLTPLLAGPSGSGTQNTGISAFYPNTSVNGSPADTVHKLTVSQQSIAFDNYGDLIIANRINGSSSYFYKYASGAYTGTSQGVVTTATGSVLWEPFSDNNDNWYYPLYGEADLITRYNNACTSSCAAGTASTTWVTSGATDVVTGHTATGAYFLDSSNNQYYGYNSGMVQIAAYNTATPVVPTYTSSIAGAYNLTGVIDGAGLLFTENYNSANPLYVQQSSSPGSGTYSVGYTYNPCYAPNVRRPAQTWRLAIRFHCASIARVRCGYRCPTQQA